MNFDGQYLVLMKRTGTLDLLNAGGNNRTKTYEDRIFSVIS